MITEDGDYLSNLRAPDLRPNFKHLTWRTMPHSYGHLVASDWADKADDDPVFGIYKQCGFWTRDEAAILCAWVHLTGMQAAWTDIGAHTGWTSKHINWMSNSLVQSVDPMFRRKSFAQRFCENTGFPLGWMYELTSNEYFEGISPRGMDGFCIDGDHDAPAPLRDAQNAAAHLAHDGVILFHDFVGQPVREAVTWLMDHGFNARIYDTPYGVAACWRGNVFPPDHEPDPRVDWAARRASFSDFNFERTK